MTANDEKPPLKCVGAADTGFRENLKKLKRQAGTRSRAHDLQNLFRFGLARGRAAGRVPGQRRRYPRRLHSFFACLAGGRDGQKAFFRPDRPVSDRGGCRRAGRGAALGAVAQRRAVSASLWRTRSRGGNCHPRPICAARRHARHSGAWPRDPRLRCLLAAAAALVRSGGRASAGDPGPAAAAAGAAAAGRSKTGGAGVRAELSQSDRHGRGLRQERGGAGRAVAAWLRLCRDRHGDPEAANRQSAAAAVPARARRGRDQPHGVQQ